MSPASEGTDDRTTTTDPLLTTPDTRLHSLQCHDSAPVPTTGAALVGLRTRHVRQQWLLLHSLELLPLQHLQTQQENCFNLSFGCVPSGLPYVALPLSTNK
ncbi:hypothetical protein J6590_080141 [Homalodisca vitripennis]|nr:hypothetical protein J6590_080141 [Homalodisca vitripennis]